MKFDSSVLRFCRTKYGSRWSLCCFFVAAICFASSNGRGQTGQPDQLADRTAKSTLISVPQESIDYKRLAFFPDRWEQQKMSTAVYPWVGRKVSFLSPTNKLDAKVMTQFVEHLDRGYEYYQKTIGVAPRNFKTHQGKAVIASVPNSGLTCGFACGYVGSTGIEVSNFSNDYSAVKKNPKSMPHYYFYEMGRNHFVFGNRHDAFTTGYAVFMRYCCIDDLGIADNDAATRAAIDGAIDRFEKSELSFFQAFTNTHGLTEKQNRFSGYRGPCDQPVMYASAMLKLKKKFGKKYTAKFYRSLLKLPATAATTKKQVAEQQCLLWLVAASAAAEQDLTSVFVGDWRMPISEKLRKQLGDCDWAEGGEPVSQLLRNAWSGTE